MSALNRISFAAAAMSVGLVSLAAQTAPADVTVQRMARSIQKEIVTLPNYGVFDDLNFGIRADGGVVLRGFASRPTLKDSAERVVKGIEGVTAVENKIQVLPLSPNDDRIRAGVYARVYGHTALSRYNPNRGVPRFFSLAMAAGGITNDPPLGFHPIHIIVNNGNVTLTGVVDNSGDKAIAGIQANSTPGAFTVDNDIIVANKENMEHNKSRKSK